MLGILADALVVDIMYADCQSKIDTIVDIAGKVDVVFANIACIGSVHQEVGCSIPARIFTILVHNKRIIIEIIQLVGPPGCPHGVALVIEVGRHAVYRLANSLDMRKSVLRAVTVQLSGS